MSTWRDPWLRPVTGSRPDSAVRLFCLPYAGGSATVFRAWRSAAADVEVHAVQLPGRGRRVAEPPLHDARVLARRLAAALEPHLDRPYGIYGHSMGGIVGLALAHELARSRPPSGLFVGASVAPSSVRPVRVWRGTDEELLRWLEWVGGTPAHLLDRPGLRKLLPVLRADLAVVAGYRGRPGERLAVPVTGFAGASDPFAGRSAMLGWERETDAGFTLSEVPGDHFFLAGSGRLVLDSVTASLLAATRSGNYPTLVAQTTTVVEP
ncbi:alpha/beta fold hydrolase [Actinosynnema sp. NPDC047251]|uniref:Putative thioesterase n=1 Tax=Saccharothrix espanaensis (strain ATCC 51144 / DSM 44229 / JCM 9112 / NBRC 15066 / NRRL 15764) TaxID=1179773 RepID=K0JU59_SACES|nr:alpha/beta fold hydrolase [Saccharothrix espanaensis]CCH29461.1 putative thioesterase [Saccharothrix espanaensis DSM 44229]